MTVNENMGGKPNTGYEHDFGTIWAKFYGVFNGNDQFALGDEMKGIN